MSVDEVPSLTSSNSTMTRDNTGNRPQFRDGQRSASLSSAAVTRKRSSMASLSRLISSSHGEKSKLSIESRAPSVSDVERKEKSSKGKRISRLMQFWKPKDSSSSTQWVTTRSHHISPLRYYLPTESQRRANALRPVDVWMMNKRSFMCIFLFQDRLNQITSWPVFFLFVYSATAISAGEISSICINCNETSSLELSGIQFDSLCVLLSLLDFGKKWSLIWQWEWMVDLERINCAAS